ncbi:DNRLRE domain-containing protein [Nocardiopsis alba]|uniref:DNRLRE domain-containing protein n=1 Tax=Nocardiopsis alba TaxID=53437 RepID=UPI0035E141D4
MRRSLTRATAVLSACSLLLSLGATAPATATEQPPALDDVTAASKNRAVDTTKTFLHHGGAQRSDELDVAHAADRSGSESGETDRTEVESSSWTYVDRAFPDRSYEDVEVSSVGMGHLEWDRSYTRRILFRFPVDADLGAVADSVVLRAEVVWSYDCAGSSSMELHRVDPFDTGVTWNDQPEAHALLDTRTLRGGREACSVDGGVEFDVTEAYRRAAEEGESHLHLRLGERDEERSEAWRRFDVEEAAPTLLVDHDVPRSPDPDRTRDEAVDTAPVVHQAAASHESHSIPSSPSTVPTPALSDDVVLRGGGVDGVRVVDVADEGRSHGGPALRRYERVGGPIVPMAERAQDESSSPCARGPPKPGPHIDLSRSTDRGRTVDG